MDVSSSPDELIKELGRQEKQAAKTETLLQEEEFSKLIMAAKEQLDTKITPVIEKEHAQQLVKPQEIAEPRPQRLEPAALQESIKPTPETVKQPQPQQRSLVTEAAQMAFDYDRIPEILKRYQYQLLDQGVDLELVRKVIKVSSETLNPKALDDPKRTKNHLRQQLEAMLSIQRSDVLSRNQVICFIGTSGVGKTTAVCQAGYPLYTEEWNEGDLGVCRYSANRSDYGGTHFRRYSWDQA